MRYDTFTSGQRQFLSHKDPHGRWEAVARGGYYRGKPRVRLKLFDIGPQDRLKAVRFGLEELRAPSRGDGSYRRGYCHGYGTAIDDIRELRSQRITRLTEILNFLCRHLEGVLSAWRSRQVTNYTPPAMLYPDRYDEICKLVRARDGDRCTWCGSGKELEFDHEREIADGGISSVDNMRLLCRPCHHRKSMASAEARRA